MTIAAEIKQRAFAVWWKDFGYWQVHSLRLSLTNKCNWPTVRLSEIAVIRSDIVPEKELATEKVKLLDRISFDEGKVFFGKRTVTRMTQFRARPGDLVVSKINARKRAVGVVQEGEDVGITIHFRALIPDKERVNTEFLWAALRSPYCLQQFEVETGGIGKGEISEERLLAVNVPLPSLSEQAAIVACWRKAQDKIAAANDRIAKLEAEVPLIIYHLLGTPPPLTKKPAEKYLALWWKDLERWSFNFLSRSAQGLTGFSTSKYPIVSLGDHLIETMNGFCIKPVAGPTPHKMLKLNALLPCGLDLGASKFIKIPDRTAQRFSIHKGDLFICRSVGSYSHVAKCALAREDAPDTLFPDIMIRVRLKNTLLPEYVCEVIQSPLGRSFFQSNARTSVGMWKIGAEDVASFPLPIPPLSVQRRIIESMATKRKEIAHETANAARLESEIKAEIEALILGTKRIGA